MPDTELLIPLAEIAGVFVGFGALIAVRSGGPTDPLEVGPMRVVVSMGMVTIVAGLTPGTLGRFDLTEHDVWALSSAVVLVAWLVTLAAIVRAPESRAAFTEAGSRARWIEVTEWVAYVLLMALWTLTPVIIIVGVVPELEAALYYAYVALLLLGAGWTLLTMVFAQRRPAAA